MNEIAGRMPLQVGSADAVANSSQRAAAAVTPLATRWVTDVDGWQALREIWDELLLASTDSTPWQSWDYLTNWWRHLGKGKELRILVVSRREQPVMIFPLQLTRELMIGIPTRMLEPISMLWDVNRPRFALGPFDEEAYRVGLRAISALPDWDCLRVEELPISDPQAQAMREFAEREGLWFRNVLSSICPHLSLEQTWAQFLQGRGSKLRKNLRAARRRLEALGPVTFHVATTVADIDRGLQTMLDLHRRSWKRRKRVGLSLSRALSGILPQLSACDWPIGEPRVCSPCVVAGRRSRRPSPSRTSIRTSRPRSCTTHVTPGARRARCWKLSSSST
jgi:hypothetical protein